MHALFIGLNSQKKSIDKNHWSRVYLHAKSFQIVLAHQPRPQAQPFPLRGKHSRKRAVGPGRKCRKKCMIQRKSDKIVFY